MTNTNAKDLFTFITERVKELADTRGRKPHQVFPEWFGRMFYHEPEGFLAPDGAGDAKIDLVFRTVTGGSVTYHAINSKYTETFGQTAPVGFYDEIIAFVQLFEDAQDRGKFMERKVRPELHAFYRSLFKAHDSGNAKLMFLTTCRANPGQLARVEHLPVQVFHLEELLQHVLDDLDGAMPRTDDLVLQEIGSVLSPGVDESSVSTTIVFARLLDFVAYMEADPFELLFARNVRVPVKGSEVNKAIRETFISSPEQFAYSNNGVTVLCEAASHDHGSRELRLLNPRVVNGSQTLHTVRDAWAAVGSGLPPASKRARVMVRIVTIPPPKGADGPKKAVERKEVINRISIRSNQQNPIRSWDLRANDDFQMDIWRRFREAGLFYERRAREWSQRASQLKSVGIRRGPTNKKLVTYLACFFWKMRQLGPAEAKSRLGEVFQGEGYDYLRTNVSPELAYQVCLVGWKVDWALRQLKQQKYRNARSHVDLLVLAMAFQLMTAEGAEWRKTALTAQLEDDDSGSEALDRAWRQLVQAAADKVVAGYAAAERSSSEDLTLKNYVRRKEETARLLATSWPGSVRKAARVIVGA